MKRYNYIFKKRRTKTEDKYMIVSAQEDFLFLLFFFFFLGLGGGGVGGHMMINLRLQICESFQSYQSTYQVRLEQVCL